MRRRVWSRGVSAIMVAALVAIVIGLLGAGYWWMSKKGGLGGSSFDLAGHLPRSARAAWMLNLRGQVDPEAVKSGFADLLSKLPPEQREKFEADFQKEFGVAWTESTSFLDGRAATAVIQPADKPGLVALVGLRDSAAFSTLMKAKVPAGTKTETAAGLTFYVSPQGAYAGHDDHWIYLADSKASVEALVASAAGKDSLSAEPVFQEARGRVESKGSLMSFYWDVASTVKAVAPLGLPYTDEQTYKNLACLQYAVGSMDLRGKQCDAFLKVIATEGNPLAEKLLAKGCVTPASFAALTGKTEVGQAIDLEWTFNTLVAMAMLSPETRQTASMAPMGLAFYGNPWGGFEGDLASTGNWAETLAQVFTSNFGAARAQGQLTACKSNLKNLGTALEMWSTDNSGRYPKTVAELTPNYLKTIPQCPAAGADTYSSTFKATSNPDLFSIACSGNHHGQTEANLPAYRSDVGLVEGIPIPGADPKEPPMPSFAASASVKDIKLAHGMMAKMLPSAGAEPKAGEEKVYEVPGATVRMITKAPSRMLFGSGEKAEVLLDTTAGNLSDKPRLKEALGWAGEGAIYADYMNLTPLVATFKGLIPDDGKPESQMARAILEKLEGVDLEGASCLVARADGLHWRSFGVSTGAVAFGAGGGAAVLVPNFIKARSQGQLTACKSNLKNIGTGLEMWSVDNSGKYPTSLAQLTPDYLREIPACPAAAAVTYTAQFGKSAPLNTEGYADYYYVECTGGNHQAAGVAGNYPAYNGVQGLIESQP